MLAMMVLIGERQSVLSSVVELNLRPGSHCERDMLKSEKMGEL